MVDGYLMHHGIKGQKWGVRRYQNEDGTYTEEGRKRRVYRGNVIRNRPHTKAVNDIVDTLSTRDKKLLGAPTKKGEKWINPKYEAETLSNKAKTIVLKEGETPVSFVEIWTDGGNVGQIALATRSGKQYRGKGYASKAVKEAIKWTEQYGNTQVKELQWIAENSNDASINLAKKYGFEKDPNPHDWDNEYTYMIKKNPNYKGG